MKYLNTREAFLSTINETFTNEITWGGSLLGRLINSIIRKAKIGINYLKVDDIAKAIEKELDALILESKDKETQESASNITITLLLQAIYDVVQSDQTEQQKIYQLLDKEEDNIGLINQTIELLKNLPDDVQLGAGNKADLISKLEKFRDLLEKISEEVGPINDEDKEELEDEVNKEDDKIEDTSGDEEKVLNTDEEMYLNTAELLQSVVDLHYQMNDKKTSNKEETLTGDNIDNTDNRSNTKVSHQAALPSGQKFINKGNDNKNLNQGVENKNLKQGPEQKQIGTSERLLDFWNFYSRINEFVELPNGDKTNNQTNQTKGKWNVVDKGGKKPESDNKPTGDYIDYEDVKPEDNPIWNKIVNAYNKSGISQHIPMIINLLKKAKEGGELEKTWIVRIGKQIKINTQTIGKNAKPTLESASDVITNAIPKSISLLSNTFLGLRGKDEVLQKLGKAGNCLTTFIKSYDTVIKLELGSKQDDEKLKDRQQVKGLNPKAQVSDEQAEEQEQIRDNFRILKFNKFLKINESDLPVPIEEEENDDRVEDTTSTNTSVSDKVKNSWFTVFKHGEEKEWKIENNSNNENIENTPTQINLEDSKDRIIKIANLFGKAYRCYVHSRIPSGRPGGKVSNQTFREYIHLGTGGIGSPDDPGTGPWASRVVYNKFCDLISELIENNKYKKIFNRATIKRTDGSSMPGNVLLEFIRDMIDENELKSYDANRSKLLNKYFRLEYTSKSDSGINSTTGNPSAGSREDSSSLRWVTQDNPIKALKKGSFVALNCDFHETEKQGGALNRVKRNKVLVGQVMGFNDGKVFVKYSYDTEAIPNAYSGYDILPEAERLDGCSNKNDHPVHLGVIDLNMTTLRENHPFVMANTKTNDLGKNGETNLDKIYKKEFTPVKSGKKAKIPSRKHNVAVAILSKRNDEGMYETIVADIKVNKKYVTDDIVLPNDVMENVYTDLVKKLEDKSAKIS